jgi:hypothetical protein
MTDDETEEKPAPPASAVPPQAKPEPASKLPEADPWTTEGSESGA